MLPLYSGTMAGSKASGIPGTGSFESSVSAVPSSANTASAVSVLDASVCAASDFAESVSAVSASPASACPVSCFTESVSAVSVTTGTACSGCAGFDKDLQPAAKKTAINTGSTRHTILLYTFICPPLWRLSKSCPAECGKNHQMYDSLLWC